MQIETDAPNAWKDFMKFYKEEFEMSPVLANIEFLQMPFEMQIGIYLKYFYENGVELDLQNTDFPEWPAIVSEAFKIHDKVIGHFS